MHRDATSGVLRGVPHNLARARRSRAISLAARSCRPHRHSGLVRRAKRLPRGRLSSRGETRPIPDNAAPAKPAVWRAP